MFYTVSTNTFLMVISTGLFTHGLILWLTFKAAAAISSSQWEMTFIELVSTYSWTHLKILCLDWVFDQ